MRLAHARSELRPHLLPLILGSARTAAAFLKKLPGNTVIHDSLSWSMWDGKLAMVHGPDYYLTHGSGDVPPELFDPVKLARKYSVRYATDMRGNRLAPPNPSMLGFEIVVRNRSANYWDTTWTSQRDMFGPLTEGTFEKKMEEFWVAVPMKDLGPREVRTLSHRWDEQGFVDLTGMKVRKGDVVKLLKMRDFDSTQDLNPDLANLAYEMVKAKNNYQHTNGTEDQRLWDSIPGVYKLDNKRDKVMLYIKR